MVLVPFALRLTTVIALAVLACVFPLTHLLAICLERKATSPQLKMVSVVLLLLSVVVVASLFVLLPVLLPVVTSMGTSRSGTVSVLALGWPASNNKWLCNHASHEATCLAADGHVQAEVR